MDLGNKKGPVGRWDFDTPEEYSEYMSTREALPKAAFQYGKLPLFLTQVWVHSSYLQIRILYSGSENITCAVPTCKSWKLFPFLKYARRLRYNFSAKSFFLLQVQFLIEEPGDVLWNTVYCVVIAW